MSSKKPRYMVQTQAIKRAVWVTHAETDDLPKAEAIATERSKTPAWGDHLPRVRILEAREIATWHDGTRT